MFETTKIDYNIPIAPEQFELDLPNDVIWRIPESEIKTDKNISSMTPEEFTYSFFKAASDGDWKTVALSLGLTDIQSEKKKYVKGLEIIYIGKAEKSADWVGYFVPYEIMFKDGEKKSYKLAVRKDNPGKMWRVDGGLIGF